MPASGGQRGFEVVCEIEPPTRPDLDHVRDQIEVLGPVATSFLIPDNHLGRATVSSVAVAHEVAVLGGRSIACVNARDRNVLGLQRDLLTAAAYGVDEFLFVYGDAPTSGSRASDLTVRQMLDAARAFEQGPELGGSVRFRLGAAAGLRSLPDWKRAADFLFVQVGLGLEPLVRWHDRCAPEVPVYAGVLTLASPAMARRLAASIPDIDLPPTVLADLERDPLAGVEAACSLVAEIEATGRFAGVHLVPVSRYREVAARLPSRRPSS